jgi:hypothetical protein
VEELLETHGWTGETNAIIGVKLTPDNTRVNSARPILVGAWGDGPIRIQAQKIWPAAADNLLLEVNLGDMALFRFPEGEMASHYIPGETAKNSIIISGQDGTQRAIEEDEREAAGIGNFCMRANCYMAKSTSTQEGVWLATTILIYPGTEDGMVDKSTLTHKASWPGIKLAEGDICLRLQAGKNKEAMRGKTWGCPVAPAIVPGVPWTAAPGPLESGEIKRAIGGLLTEGVVRGGEDHPGAAIDF